MTTVDKAAKIAAEWGTCEGCGISKAKCDRWTAQPDVIKCCPDCNHVTTLTPRTVVPEGDMLKETAEWMVVLHDCHGDPTKCLACRNPHPCPTRRLAEAYLQLEEADSLTLDKNTGDWLRGGPITGEQGDIMAASLLPGTSPEQVREWYHGWLSEDEPPPEEPAPDFRYDATGGGHRPETS